MVRLNRTRTLPSKRYLGLVHLACLIDAVRFALYSAVQAKQHQQDRHTEVDQCRIPQIRSSMFARSRFDTSTHPHTYTPRRLTSFPNMVTIGGQRQRMRQMRQTQKVQILRRPRPDRIQIATSVPSSLDKVPRMLGTRWAWVGPPKQ